MDCFVELKNTVLQSVTATCLVEDAPLQAVEIMPPKDPAHGEIATNAALVLAGPLKTNPRALADKIAEELKKQPIIASVSVAGPGFINLVCKPEFWQGVLPVILEKGAHYGDSNAGKGEKVNVEYVSANPTGPMHVGHTRGAVFGDALARLLAKAGFKVTKEYYINDAGAQIDKLAESAFHRYREALGEPVGEVPEGLYPGDYLVPLGKLIAQNFGQTLKEKPRSEWLPLVRKLAIEEMMKLIREDLALLGISHDVFTSEQALTQAGKVDEAIAELERKGLIYIGTLEPPKGKAPDDWEPKPQTLFKSTLFGDDLDRAIKKSDGSWTYFAPDIAYHWDKLKRGYTRLIDVFGADHGGYVSRIKAVVKALGGDEVKIDVKLCQLVKFLRGGEPAKMSKRAGTFVTARDVVEEVGKDVLRFMMLTRKNDMPIDFDFEKAKEQSKDNPVFYVQYAHARVHSVLRMAAAETPEALAVAAPDLSQLTHPAELALIRLLADWPRLVEGAALAGEPHRVAFYLQDVAAQFHGLWNVGGSDLSLRFLQKDAISLTAARLMLLKSVATVIRSGLEVLGVAPVESM